MGQIYSLVPTSQRGTPQAMALSARSRILGNTGPNPCTLDHAEEVQGPDLSTWGQMKTTQGPGAPTLACKARKRGEIWIQVCRPDPGAQGLIWAMAQPCVTHLACETKRLNATVGRGSSQSPCSMLTLSALLFPSLSAP